MRGDKNVPGSGLKPLDVVSNAGQNKRARQSAQALLEKEKEKERVGSYQWVRVDNRTWKRVLKTEENGK